jgi:2-aminobenzoate-CoA ligase
MRSAHVDPFVRDRLPPPELQPEFLFDLPELHYPERLNGAVELIGTGAADALAVVNDSGAWTYGEMRDLSDRIARLLVEEEGLVPGNRVLLRGPNSAMLFAAWLGVLKAGGVLVTTMPLLRSGEIATLLERAQIHHAIVDESCLGDFMAAADSRPASSAPCSSIAAIRAAARSKSGWSESRPASAGDTHRDDVAMIAFTSGTTGTPKGCVQYHRDLLAPADSFARALLKPEAGERWACSAPIAFTFGLGMILLFPWRFGGSAVTIGQPGAKALLEAVAKHRVTRLATAPTAYKAMLPLLVEHDISSLRHLRLRRRAPARGDLAGVAGCHGLAIVDGIGATEMMHIFISAAGEDIRPGATGKAVPGYRACVLGDGGQPLPSRHRPARGQGPDRLPLFRRSRQADYVQGGWNVTGDTYRQDEEGYFWFVARSDDMIVSSGYNIAAPEVENALYAHPAVQECAVVGVPCEERGQQGEGVRRPRARRASRRGLGPSASGACQGAIAPYKYPREVEFVAALPKTATGKLQRFQLRT